nr:immunoglobulin heavy chain junction region [Macaca mulatta]MOV49042.1 immunoglobulin heavy chain junction region [Macaca mulatta]MOV49301.1 immunoglobulin heavy chain junction region [Macaca mulatta]MOV50606.1 immunoglobulin heavy chain junction region [Macaca mulatta]MOV50612.1 immunoglobulin heavy chain junction region [Macaca mulatta]
CVRGDTGYPPAYFDYW